MNCKNCGARLKDDAKVCPNCGAFIDDASGYVLLTADDRIDDYYSDYNKPNKPSKLKLFLISLLVIALAGGGSFVYFRFIAPAVKKAPEVSLNGGTGIINGDEPVIYVTVDRSAGIEYIHGVKLYDYDITDYSAGRGEPVSEDYEYTKNIDSSFRAVFFDAEPLHLEEGKDYTYSLEMAFSFAGSTDIFYYSYPLTFSSDISEDAADIVFDHSMYETAADKVTQAAEQETTTAKAQRIDADFIYDGYWFTLPVTEGETRKISALKFRSDGTYSVTHYEKSGNANWNVTTENGTYALDGNVLEAGDSTFTIDGESKTLTDADGQPLSERVYNSVKNAEDFFGL